SSHGGLVILWSVSNGPEGRGNWQATERFDQCVGIRRAGFAQALGQRDNGAVSNNGSKARVIVVPSLVCLEKSSMFRRINSVPGIACDHPPLRSFLAQGVQIFRFAGKQAYRRKAIQKTTLFAGTNEFGQVCRKQHVE